MSFKLVYGLQARKAISCPDVIRGYISLAKDIYSVQIKDYILNVIIPKCFILLNIVMEIMSSSANLNVVGNGE